MSQKIEKRELVAAVLQQVIIYSFYFLIFLVPLVFTTQNYELFEFPKMLLVYTATVIIGLSWLGKSIAEGKITFRPTILLIPLIAFLLANTVSTVFSVDQHTSIFGYYSRFNGGLLSIISYLILFFAFVSNFNRLNVVNFLSVGLLGALVVSFWGIPSHFGYDPTCKLLLGKWTSSCWTAEFSPEKRIFATLGQPNWLAAYLALYLPLTLAFLLIAQTQIQKFFFFAAANILYWAFLLTNSRAASLGLAAGFLVFGALYIAALAKTDRGNLFSHLKDKFNGLWILATLATFIIITNYYGSQLLGRINEALPFLKNFSQTTQTATGQNPPESQPIPKTETVLATGGTESGQIRLIVWRGGWEIFKHYPIFGSGVETFAYTYYQYRPVAHNQTTEWNFLYNKAHNEYLNYLATTGAVGLASYLLVIATFIFAAVKFVLKRGEKNVNKQYSAEIPSPPSPPDGKKISQAKIKLIVAALLAGYISYLIQNFFGFSVVVIALLFFLFPASFLVLAGQELKSFEILFGFKIKKLQRTTNISVIALVLVAVFLIFVIVRIWQSDVLFAKSRNTQAEENYHSAYLLLRDANSLLFWKEPLYLSDQGFVTANLAVSSEEAKDQENYFTTALESTKEALSAGRFNLDFWRQAAKTYFILSQLQPELEKSALEAISTATLLAPTEPEIWYQEALLEKATGFEASASASLKHALELKPDFEKAAKKFAEWQKK